MDLDVPLAITHNHRIIRTRLPGDPLTRPAIVHDRNRNPAAKISGRDVPVLIEKFKTASKHLAVCTIRHSVRSRSSYGRPVRHDRDLRLSRLKLYRQQLEVDLFTTRLPANRSANSEHLPPISVCPNRRSVRNWHSHRHREAAITVIMRDLGEVKFHHRFNHVSSLIEIRLFLDRLKNNSVHRCWVVLITTNNRHRYSSFNRRQFIIDRLPNSRHHHSKDRRSLPALDCR